MKENKAVSHVWSAAHQHPQKESALTALLGRLFTAQVLTGTLRVKLEGGEKPEDCHNISSVGVLIGFRL